MELNKIHKMNNSLAISSDGLIAGIQINIKAKHLELNSALPMDVSMRTINDDHVILIYGLHGETLSGEKVQIISSLEDYEITSIIVVNIFGDSMEIDLMNSFVPENFELSQNYPNPFNPITNISFSLGRDEWISLNVFDIQGRLIRSLINDQYFLKGQYQMTWNGKNNYGKQVPSGMYLYKLIGDQQIEIKKMILMK